MESLNLFKEREYYEVTLTVKGKPKAYKIPCEFTVEETERLMEREIILKKLFNEEVPEDKKDQDRKLQEYLAGVFEILSILFAKYQTEMNPEKMKKLLTQKEALQVLQFFKEKRFLQLMGLDNETSKKKQPTALKDS